MSVLAVVEEPGAQWGKWWATRSANLSRRAGEWSDRAGRAGALTGAAAGGSPTASSWKTVVRGPHSASFPAATIAGWTRRKYACQVIPPLPATASIRLTIELGTGRIHRDLTPKVWLSPPPRTDPSGRRWGPRRAS